MSTSEILFLFFVAFGALPILLLGAVIIARVFKKDFSKPTYIGIFVLVALFGCWALAYSVFKEYSDNEIIKRQTINLSSTLMNK